MRIFSILFASLASIAGLTSAGEAEANFDSRFQPTFRRVFELGFRPSLLSQYSVSEVRDWNLRPVRILIGSYEFKCVSEMTTFEVYDTGSLSSLTVVANRKAPVPVKDALTEAEALLNAAGAKSNPVAQWRENFRSTGKIRFEGFRAEIENNIRVSVEIYPDGLGDKLASLAVQIEWPYDGKLPPTERTRVPLKTPPGYDWDMSFEEWQRRMREPRKQSAEQENAVGNAPKAP